jgi:hypothetical protein
VWTLQKNIPKDFCARVLINDVAIHEEDLFLLEGCFCKEKKAWQDGSPGFNAGGRKRHGKVEVD